MKQFILLLGAFALFKQGISQKYIPTYFINMLITDQKLDSIFLLGHVDSTTALRSGYFTDYGNTKSDSNNIKQQLKQPYGRIKLRKIKGARLLSNKEVSTIAATGGSYCKMYRPVFFDNDKIFIMVEFIASGGKNYERTYTYEKMGNTYRCTLFGFNFKRQYHAENLFLIDPKINKQKIQYSDSTIGQYIIYQQ